MHFYTVLRVISSSCESTGNIIAIIHESNDAWGKIINTNIYMLSNMCPNLYLIWSKSVKLTKAIVNQWIKIVLVPAINAKLSWYWIHGIPKQLSWNFRTHLKIQVKNWRMRLSGRRYKPNTTQLISNSFYNWKWHHVDYKKKSKYAVHRQHLLLTMWFYLLLTIFCQNYSNQWSDLVLGNPCMAAIF